MNSNHQKDQNEHSLTMISRRELQISGVTQIISFDDALVALSTVCGELDVDGSGLNIDALDLDRKYAAVSGEIIGINYISDRPKKRRKFRGGE